MKLRNTFRPPSVTVGGFALIAATIALAAINSANAASTMTNVGWEWLFAQNAGQTTYDVSVYDGSASWAGTDDTGAATSGTFGDGTVEGYAFFNAAEGADPGFGDGDETIQIFASGGSSITGTSAPGRIQNNGNAADIWTTTDPSGFTSPADITNPTVAVGLLDSAWTGTIDISSYTSGTVYFMYGHYRGNQGALDLDLTMRDTNGSALDIELLNAGSTDGVNNWEQYISEISFVNDEGHDVIDYVFNFNGNGRLGGIVIDGAVIPEPTAALLGGLGLLALLRRRR